MMGRTRQTGPYIPDDDAGAREWMNNFAKHIASAPAAVGLSAADAATLTALAEAFDAAMERAGDPKMRTLVTIAEKDEARNAAKSAFRTYAMQIKANRGVDDAQKIALGIHVDSGSRTPIGAPINEPLLDIVAGFPGRHVLRYHDAATPKSRRKPPGASHLLLFAAIEEYEVRDPDQARFIGAYTRQPFDISFDVGKHAKKTATYFGRWLTAKGLLGPWSLPVSMTISAGSAATPAAGSVAEAGSEESEVEEPLHLAA
jgi:hypothetical protein